MTDTLSRRQRRVVWTLLSVASFVVALSAFFWIKSLSRESYVPGEDVEGLTESLARTLPADYPRVTFSDATRDAGLDFRHFSGVRTSQMPEDMGSGAAWGDYDNDGWIDLYVVNEIGPITMTESERAASPAGNQLYHNNGDGTFTEVGQAAGVSLRGWGMSAVWGDYDNDGFLDLFVSNFGHNVLFHNNGHGGFSNVSAPAGVTGPEGFWVGAAWGDYNRDGFLDLYVPGYVKYVPLSGQASSRHYDVETPANLNPSSFEPERNLLYRNNGDGTFSEVARETGVLNAHGRSLGAVWTDFDEDGWPDLYVANDVSDNVFYHNLAGEAFEEIGSIALVADYRGAMGIAVGDWDGDADIDMFITHWIAQENALYSNLRSNLASARQRMQFMDVADRFGLGQIALDYIGWGTSFFDYDNDGRLDLFVANGSTFQRKDSTQFLVPMRDLLFWNGDSERGFFDVSEASGSYFSHEYVGRGAAFGDYDRDGDVDIFVVNHGGPGFLLRNDGGNRQHWLEVALSGRKSNRSAIGARIRAVADGTVQLRVVGAQRPYASANSLVAHFGFGERARVDSLEITWPSGALTLRTGIETDQTLEIIEEDDLP